MNKKTFLKMCENCQALVEPGYKKHLQIKRKHAKNYYLFNSEKLLSHSNQYYKNNKENITQRIKQGKWKCDTCNKTLQQSSKANHLKSKVHKSNADANPNTT